MVVQLICCCWFFAGNAGTAGKVQWKPNTPDRFILTPYREVDSEGICESKARFLLRLRLILRTGTSSEIIIALLQIEKKGIQPSAIGDLLPLLLNCDDKTVRLVVLCYILRHSAKSGDRRYRTVVELQQKALSVLVSFLNDNDVRYRQTVVAAIASAGEKASWAGPTLVKQMKLEKPERAISLAKALWDIDPMNRHIMDYLFQTIRSDNWVSQRLALATLEQIGNSEDLKECLGNNGTQGQFKSRIKEAVSAIISLAEGKDEQLEQNAMKVLMWAGDHAKLALPMVVKKLQSRNHSIQWMAIQILSNIPGKESRVAIPELLDLVRTHTNRRVRSDAIDLLSGLDPKSITIANVLLDALEDCKEGVRLSAAHAIMRLSPHVLMKCRKQLTSKLRNATDNHVKILLCEALQLAIKAP